MKQKRSVVIAAAHLLLISRKLRPTQQGDFMVLMVAL